MSAPRIPISSILPPLIFGTATLNYQFNPDPYALGPNDIVFDALAAGIRAFDTSPYYGPSETILSDALHHVSAKSSLSSLDTHHVQRSDYFILTKCGRIAGSEFDYSPAWIEFSVRRSLRRLRTTYLDVVYLHDCEFVSTAEVLAGIHALRQLRDQGLLRYIGISGYPVHILAELAEFILRETGEPVDIVQSYANFTLQNQSLDLYLDRFKQASVDVIVNASPLGMGLLRHQGVPVGAMGDWHPAPNELRERCLAAAILVTDDNRTSNLVAERLETIALRWALGRWRESGSPFGTMTDASHERPRKGISCIGVSSTAELEEVMAIYASVTVDPVNSDREQWPVVRRDRADHLAQQITDTIFTDRWKNYCWTSPDKKFKNTRTQFGVSQQDLEREKAEAAEQTGSR